MISKVARHSSSVKLEQALSRLSNELRSKSFRVEAAAEGVLKWSRRTELEEPDRHSELRARETRLLRLAGAMMRRRSMRRLSIGKKSRPGTQTRLRAVGTHIYYMERWVLPALEHTSPPTYKDLLGHILTDEISEYSSWNDEFEKGAYVLPYILRLFGRAEKLGIRPPTQVRRKCERALSSQSRIAETTERIKAKASSLYEASYSSDKDYQELIGSYESELMESGEPNDGRGQLAKRIRQDCVQVTRFRKSKNMTYDPRFLYSQAKNLKDITALYESLQFHPKIRDASERLFKDDHYSEAIFAAYKAVNNFVKEQSGLYDLDGQELMARAFKEDQPIIRLNQLRTETDKTEQYGFKFLYMGAFMGVRDPKAHDDIIQEDPYKTLEYLGFASLLAKRVDEATIHKVSEKG